MKNTKFRAHVDKDVIENRPAETYQVVNLDWDDDGLVCGVLFSSETQTFHTLEAKWFNLIEYIGRQTKDGKEIYEGDIISATYWSGKEYDDWVEKEVVAKVCWSPETVSFILVEDTKFKPLILAWSRVDEDSFKIISSIT